MEKVPRKDIETECLTLFDRVQAELGCGTYFRGTRSANRFNPGFGLVGNQRFQFGDRRVELPDRIVVIEVESGGGVTNLMKYWPLAASLDRPLLLLHGFGQGSANDFLSHLILWDYLWSRMRDDVWSGTNPRLFARRFQYTHGSIEQLAVAAEMFRECLTLPLDQVVTTIFAYGPAVEPN